MKEVTLKEKSVKWVEAPSIKASDLSDSINQTMKNISAFIKSNRLEVDNSALLDNLSEFDYSGHISNMTKSAKKKLAKKLRYMSVKITRKSINSIFWFIEKVVKVETPGDIKCSKEELKISEIRKQYKELMAETEKARVAFRTAKKEFHAAGLKYCS